MKLHLDRDAFLALISNVSQRANIRMDIIEKDYYVTLLLWELSQKQDVLPSYFKGGTALYKALKTLNRFSEDIDLTVEINGCSNSQGKKRLENAANKYQNLQRTADKEREQNTRGSITSVYEYQPFTHVDRNDELQRFGHVKVEATSFTVSEPYETLEIEPILFTKATEEEKEILIYQFGVVPFPIKTIKMERIFADKIFAAEFYYMRGQLFDVSKHIYDLTIMAGQPRVQHLISETNLFIEMIQYKRLEEESRLGSDLAKKPFVEFTLFDAVAKDDRIRDSFLKMQSIYVFQDEDMLSFEMVEKAICNLHKILLTLNEDLEQGWDQALETKMF